MGKLCELLPVCYLTGKWGAKTLAEGSKGNTQASVSRHCRHISGFFLSKDNAGLQGHDKLEKGPGVFLGAVECKWGVKLAKEWLDVGIHDGEPSGWTALTSEITYT